MSLSRFPLLDSALAAYTDDARRGAVPLSESSLRSYLATIRVFLEFHSTDPESAEFGSRITRPELVRFLSRRPCRPATWNAELSALRSFATFLADSADLPAMRDAALSIPRRRERRIPKVALSLPQLIRLEEAALRASDQVGPRDAAIVMLLFHVGLRLSSLVALDRRDFDAQAHVLLQVPIKGGWEADFHLSDLVCASLERYLDSRPFLSDDDEPALFVSRRGGRISKRAVQEAVKRAGERAGIPRRLSPHVLRHACGTHIGAATGDVFAVRDQLKHRDVRMSDRYVHLERQRDAAEALERLWCDTSPSP